AGNDDPLTSWGLSVAQHGWLCRLLAAVTIAIEVGFPLALISRRARWILVPAELGMQIGIRVLMGPSFEQFVICYLFWVPWDRVGSELAAQRHRESGPWTAFRGAAAGRGSGMRKPQGWPRT